MVLLLLLLILIAIGFGVGAAAKVGIALIALGVLFCGVILFAIMWIYRSISRG